MSVQVWTYLFVFLSFSLYIGIAIWSRAGSTKEFYVAGGGVTPLANGMATAADWMSAASFISMAGIIAFAGYDASVYLMGWTGGYVILAMLLAPLFKKIRQIYRPRFYRRSLLLSNCQTNRRILRYICLLRLCLRPNAGRRHCVLSLP